MAQLKCKTGNYQCGGVCQSESKKCTKKAGEEASKTANDMAKLVKNTGKSKKAAGDSSPEANGKLANQLEKAMASEDKTEVNNATKALANKGQIAALGGKAAELGMIQTISEAAGIPVGDDILAEIESTKAVLGDEATNFRLEQSKDMAETSMQWARDNGYTGNVEAVLWTARPGALAEAGFPDIKQSKHPADLVVKFDDGKVLGISAKSSSTNSSKLKFKTRSARQVADNLGLESGKETMEAEKKFLGDNGFKSGKDLKKHMRANPDDPVTKAAQELGESMQTKARDELAGKLAGMSTQDASSALTDLFMDTENFGLPYIKATGTKSAGTKIDDPLNNEAIRGLREAQNIEFVPNGRFGLNIMADGKRLFNVNALYNGKKVATSLELLAK